MYDGRLTNLTGLSPCLVWVMIMLPIKLALNLPSCCALIAKLNPESKRQKQDIEFLGLIKQS